MSKKSKSKSFSQTRRDTSAIANRRLPQNVKKQSFVNVTDRRTFYPTPNRPVYNRHGKILPVRTLPILKPKRMAKHGLNLYLSAGVYSYRNSFKTRNYIPSEALICVRRKQRKEVIFAIGRAGSRRRQKTPRFNETSTLTCR